MRQSYLLVCFPLLWNCAPGSSLEPIKRNGNKSSAYAQHIGSEAIPVLADQDNTRTPPPDDPLEEEKSVEPSVIGGAYLYCGAEDGEAGSNPAAPVNVGCRMGNTPDDQWMAAEKNMFVMNSLTDMMAPITVSILPQGSGYHMSFPMDRSLQNSMELHVDVVLPQGRLAMSTSVNPGALKAIEQGLGKGLALYAATGAAGNWPGIDRKTWNLWMPIEIPKYITNFTTSASNSAADDSADDKVSGLVEIVFDETVCTYEIRSDDGRSGASKGGARSEDFVFKSCARNWQPSQWVRVKTLTLRIPERVRKSSQAAGVILKTGS
jgi:hypothetical protein